MGRKSAVGTILSKTSQSKSHNVSKSTTSSDKVSKISKVTHLTIIKYVSDSTPDLKKPIHKLDTNTFTSNCSSQTLILWVPSLSLVNSQVSVKRYSPLQGWRIREVSLPKWSQYGTVISRTWKGFIKLLIEIRRCGLMDLRKGRKTP